MKYTDIRNNGSYKKENKLSKLGEKIIEETRGRKMILRTEIYELKNK